MKFSVVVEQVLELLQRQTRISYRALKREFELDDDYIEDLKAELIDARRLAVDEDEKVLVWTGASPVQSSTFQVPSSQDNDPNLATRNTPLVSQDSALRTQHSSAERRQL